LVLFYVFVAAAALPSHRAQQKTLREKSESAMLDMLKSTQSFMTGSEKGFDSHFFQEVRSCMSTFDPNLPLAQDKAWQGIIDYWQMRGFPSDEWGKFPSHYWEYNVTVSSMNGMLIYEPCNYASNIAYYHDVIEICLRKHIGKPFSFSENYVNAIGKGFSAMAWGSSFWHGSNTMLGRQQDRKTLAVLAYVFHQASISALKSKSPILHDLSKTPRKKTAIQLIEEFQNMYLTKPVSEWYNITEAFDIPDYTLIYAGLYTTVLTLSFDEISVNTIIPILADMFNLPGDFREFLLDHYVPEIRRVTSDVHLSPPEHATFFFNTVGSTMKLVYAFLWQERVLTRSPLFLDPIVNYIGWELLPRVNSVANQFASFQYFDPHFQNGTNIYPGSSWCNPVIPHAKWHLESAIGLLDMTYLADEI
ncbi:hypothetical protein FHG87_001742, partial [Trinorchestia longiramus]